MTIRAQAHRSLSSFFSLLRAIERKRGVQQKAHSFLDSGIDLLAEIRRKLRPTGSDKIHFVATVTRRVKGA